MSTELQKKLIQLFSENIGNKKPKSIYKMMLEAGYSESSASQQSAILSRINEELEPIVEKMKAKRTLAIDKITEEKLEISSAKDLTDIVDKFTKNVQLLQGKPTENLKFDLEDETKDTIKDVLGRIGGSNSNSGE